MNQLTLSILAACFAVLVSEASGIIPWLKYATGLPHLRPFDCPMCLSFWLSLALALHSGELLYAPLIASFSAIVAILLSKTLRM